LKGKEQMDIFQPNKERFLKAISLEKGDRVPYFEAIIMKRTLEYILEKKIDAIWQLQLSHPEQIDVYKKLGIDMHTIYVSWAGFPPDYIAPDIKLDESSADKAAGYERSYIRDWEDLKKLVLPPNIFELCVNLVKEAIDSFKEARIGILVVCRSVLQNTYLNMGFTNFSRKLYKDRKLVEAVMDIYKEYALKMAEAISKLEIDCFCLDDDMADSHGLIIPPKLIEELWAPRSEEILKPYKRRNIPIAFHSDGKMEDLIPLLIDMGVKAVHPFQPNCNDIYKMKKRYGDEICLIGNIDIAGVLASGFPKEVMKDVMEHVDKLSDPPGYIVCSSHTITNGCIPINVLAMAKTTQIYGTY